VFFDGHAFPQFSNGSGFENGFRDSAEVFDPVTALSGNLFGFLVTHMILSLDIGPDGADWKGSRRGELEI
jgi:hypothetical protein